MCEVCYAIGVIAAWAVSVTVLQHCGAQQCILKVRVIYIPYERSLAEVLSAHADTIRDEVRKCIPATVTAVHPGRQTVDVQVAIRNPLTDEYGAVTFEGAPSFSEVPLGMSMGGGFFVWLPVAVGDSVWLMFSDLSMDTWLEGAGDQPVAPGWVGKHTADSPVAIPIVKVKSKVFADPNNDPNKVIIGKDGSQAQIRLSATEIELGATHGDAVGLDSKIVAELHKLQLTIASATAPSGGGPVTYGVPYSSPSSVGSTLIKAQ